MIANWRDLYLKNSEQEHKPIDHIPLGHILQLVLVDNVLTIHNRIFRPCLDLHSNISLCLWEGVIEYVFYISKNVSEF